MNDHDHRGEYAGERHDHDLDYAEKHHRHYDDEREAASVRRDLDYMIADLRDALDRIRQLVQQAPEARQADIALADAAESGYDDESWRGTLAEYHVASGGADFTDVPAEVPRLRRLRPPADVIDEDTDDEWGQP